MSTITDSYGIEIPDLKIIHMEEKTTKFRVESCKTPWNIDSQLFHLNSMIVEIYSTRESIDEPLYCHYITLYSLDLISIRDIDMSKFDKLGSIDNVFFSDYSVFGEKYLLFSCKMIENYSSNPSFKTRRHLTYVLDLDTEELICVGGKNDLTEYHINYLISLDRSKSLFKSYRHKDKVSGTSFDPMCYVARFNEETMTWHDIYVGWASNHVIEVFVRGEFAIMPIRMEEEQGSMKKCILKAKLKSRKPTFEIFESLFWDHEYHLEEFGNVDDVNGHFFDHWMGDSLYLLHNTSTSSHPGQTNYFQIFIVNENDFTLMQKIPLKCDPRVLFRVQIFALQKGWFVKYEMTYDASSRYDISEMMLCALDFSNLQTRQSNLTFHCTSWVDLQTLGHKVFLHGDGYNIIDFSPILGDYVHFQPQYMKIMDITVQFL